VYGGHEDAMPSIALSFFDAHPLADLETI